MDDGIDDEFALLFPLEFLIQATPRSLQSRNARARDDWKLTVRQTAKECVDAQRDFTLLDDRPLAAKIIYFAPAPLEGDVDNIVKLILDGMRTIVYLDDRVLERVVVQKIEPEIVVEFASLTEKLEGAAVSKPPVVYIRVDDDLSWRKAV